MAISKKPMILTAEEVSAWEGNDKFKRKVSTLKYANDEGGTDEFQVVQPSREVVNAVSDMNRRGEATSKINDCMINACVLAGEVEKLDADDALYYGLLQDLSALGDVKKSV